MTMQEMRDLPSYYGGNGQRVIYKDDYEDCLAGLKETIDFEKHREYTRGFKEGQGHDTTSNLKQELEELRVKYIKLLEYVQV